MASGILPVSRSRHAALRWLRSSDYRFAATTVVAPLAAVEVGSAALALPLAFVQREDHWGLAAVLGLLPGQNLCVDEASGLVVDGEEGESFFTEAGELNPDVARVASFLAETAQSEAALMQACDVLNSAGVIELWPITIQGEQGSQQVVGLYRVNEVTLNGLDDATHLRLRHSGALSVAYAQLLSMGNLARLGHTAQARAQAEAAERAKAEVKPMITLPEDNTIDWDWSKIGR